MERVSCGRLPLSPLSTAAPSACSFFFPRRGPLYPPHEASPPWASSNGAIASAQGLSRAPSHRERASERVSVRKGKPSAHPTAAAFFSLRSHSSSPRPLFQITNSIKEIEHEMGRTQKNKVRASIMERARGRRMGKARGAPGSPLLSFFSIPQSISISQIRLPNTTSASSRPSWPSCAPSCRSRPRKAAPRARASRSSATATPGSP